MTEHESGYFEDDDDEEDGSVKFTPQQIHERSEIVDLGSGSQSGSESDGRNGSCFSPVCLEDDCWCFEGRMGEKGEIFFYFILVPLRISVTEFRRRHPPFSEKLAHRTFWLFFIQMICLSCNDYFPDWLDLWVWFKNQRFCLHCNIVVLGDFFFTITNPLLSDLINF